VTHKLAISNVHHSLVIPSAPKFVIPNEVRDLQFADCATRRPLKRRRPRPFPSEDFPAVSAASRAVPSDGHTRARHNRSIPLSLNGQVPMTRGLGACDEKVPRAVCAMRQQKDSARMRCKPLNAIVVSLIATEYDECML
jgi:hypothetical protein